MKSGTLGLVISSAGGAEAVRERLILPLLRCGWSIAVTLTPTVAEWLTASGEIMKIEDVTGFPVRVRPRLPGERSPHPLVDCYAFVPATANSVAKLALGIADNQALTQLCEALGRGYPPIIVFPRINAAHARQPAWESHITALRTAGARLIYGADVWPLHEPGSAPGRDLPWPEILAAICSVGAPEDPAGI